MTGVRTGSRILTATCAALLFATLGLGTWVSRRAVHDAAGDLLLAEASVAQQLLAETGSPQALTTVLDGRWRELPAPPEGSLDQPTLVRSDHGWRALAARYASDRWTVRGAIEVAPAPLPEAPIPVLWLAVLIAGAGLIRLAGSWEGSAERNRRGAWAVPALGVMLGIMIPFSVAGWLAHSQLEGLTDRRLQLGADALAALPDPQSIVDRPGGVAQLTGLSFLTRAVSDSATFTTLLPETTTALAALPDPPPRRVRIGRTPWALESRPPVLLAMTPWEHTRSPWAALTGIGLAGVLLAGLPLALAPLVAEGRRRELHRNLVAWSFLAPAALHLAVFTIGPLAFALWLSFHDWTLIDPARPFVGLAHYAALVRDAEFGRALGNTALFTLHVPIAMAVALGFALLVHRRTAAGRLLTAIRAILFLPTITSLVAVAVVWQWMLNDQYGLLNWLLTKLGLDPVPWLTSPATALPAIMLMSVWLVVGYQMVLFLAGLAAIPEELYEAARIDGAGPWHRFLHVTLPGLRHTLFFVLVTSVIGSFQVFGAVYVMTEGGPLGSTDVAVYHIYREAWEFLRFGNAAAMSWILFALIFVITWLHFRLLERRAGETA